MGFFSYNITVLQILVYEKEGKFLAVYSTILGLKRVKKMF